MGKAQIPTSKEQKCYMQNGLFCMLVVVTKSVTYRPYCLTVSFVLEEN